MRVVRSLLAFLFFLAGAAAVAGTLAVYLAATGHSLPLLRVLVGHVGQVLAGQRTEQLDLDVRIRPEAQALSGTARLSVRAAAAGRQRLYFLLNDGLRVEAAWEEHRGGTLVALPWYRLWVLTIVELPRPLAADEEVRIGIAYAGNPRAGGLAATGMVLQPDDVVITTADFWYPADLQGFFHADVEVTLPSDLTLVHNGRESARVETGESTRVHWSTERPVAGLSLVAGRYQVSSHEGDDHRYRLFLDPGITLDAERVLNALATAERGLTEHYGASGFAQTTVFVNRALPRAFNDGSGLIGIAPRYFQGGDYGFAILAHEVAHDWWGATVAERWLDPGTGGEWIVEGFAEFSSWRAVREHLGEAALLRRLAERFFDPTQTGTLAEMSVLDNALDPAARATIYAKGGYVTFMLQQRLGDQAFDAAARRFLEHFRYRSATATELETVFASGVGQDLGEFFAAWVHSKDAVDLALDPQDGGAAVRNHGTAPPPPELAMWRVPPDGEPEQQSTAVGATAALGGAERLVLDPLAAVADMYRSNNVLPRRDNPRLVASSARGELMVVYGESYPWEPGTIEIVSTAGEKRHSWAFDRGFVGDPAWSADGTRVLAVEAPRDGRPALLALNVADGGRRTVSHDTAATGTADATIVARGSRLVRIAGRAERALADHPGGTVAAPLASPDGTAVAYVVGWGMNMDLRVLDLESGAELLLFTAPAGEVRWRWSPDSARLFAATPADWDWQLWELPRDGAEPRLLAQEAAGIGDLAVSPDGGRVALVAEPEVDYNRGHFEVIVLDRAAGTVRPFDLSGWTAHRVAWLDDDSLAVIVSDPTYPSLPVERALRRLRLSDGSLERMG